MGVLLEGNFFVIRIVYDHTNACYGPLNGMANSDSSHPVIMYIKCSISNGSLFLSKIGMVIVYIYLMLPSNDSWAPRIIYLHPLRMYSSKFHGDCL